MKALSIKFEHGRIWTAETTDGKRATGASLESVLSQLIPAGMTAGPTPLGFSAVQAVFDGIRDSESGQFGRGRASA